MSVEQMAWALHVPDLTAVQKLVLIGIANHDGDGGAWPSLATLATYACVSVRHVRRTIRQLEELGWISVHLQQGGNHRTRDDQRPNLFVIHRLGKRGDTQAPPTPVDNQGRGDTQVRNGRTPRSAEPSYNHPVIQSPTRVTGQCRHRWISELTGECPSCEVEAS